MRCSCGLAGAVTAVVGALAVRAAPLKRSDSSPLPDDAVALIKQRLNESATDTWTSGTYMEALLELDYPELSVFSSSSGTYPPPSSASPPFSYASSFVQLGRFDAHDATIDSTSYGGDAEEGG